MQQRAKQQTRSTWPWPLFAGTAAQDARQFLHETRLLGLLSSGLCRDGAGRRGRARVGCQVRLAVLELRLRRGSLWWREFSHALPLNLRIAVHVVPRAASGLSASRSRFGQRLIETVVINGQMSLLLSVLTTLDGHGRVLISIGVVHSLHRRWVTFEHLPAFSVVQLHPVVFAVFDLARALESLRKELTEVVVVGSVFEPEIANVA